MTTPRTVNTVGIIGTGVIGAGWCVRCLAHGLEVIAWDPAAGAERALREAVDVAWPAAERLGLQPEAGRQRLHVAVTLEEVCTHADFIQECAPEREQLKRDLYAQMDSHAAPEVILASSTSGLLPSVLQSDCKYPQRVVVGHPFNPVYLLPLVEVVGGVRTEAAVVEHAMDFYCRLGMYPLRVRTEVPGFISDRLQEALWREALHLVNEGVATTEEIDAAIAFGPGLRWSFWGVCMVFHLAGGAGGMRHMLNHFNPELFPWTKLPPPQINDELIEKMAAGTEQQTGGATQKQLMQLRDACLLSVMEALSVHDMGAGQVLRAHRERCAQRAGRAPQTHDNIRGRVQGSHNKK